MTSQSSALSIGAMLRREIPPAELIDAAKALDGVYDELWIVEDLPYAGGITQLSAVLSATEFARVGHGIAPAPFRNPVALAMEWATLANMYPGRLLAGIGHGVQDWMTQIGASVDSPLTLLEETVSAVRTLLAGERLTVDGRYVKVDGVRLEFPPPTPPPVLAGVTGPRSLRLSGAYADGTVLPEGSGPDKISDAGRKIDQGRNETGRTDHHHLTVFAGFSTNHGERPELPPEVSASWLAVGADTDEVASRLSTLIDSGIDSLVLVPIGPSPQEQLETAASLIVPSLRARATKSAKSTDNV